MEQAGASAASGARRGAVVVAAVTLVGLLAWGLVATRDGLRSVDPERLRVPAAAGDRPTTAAGSTDEEGVVAAEVEVEELGEDETEVDAPGQPPVADPITGRPLADGAPMLRVRGQGERLWLAGRVATEEEAAAVRAAASAVSGDVVDELAVDAGVAELGAARVETLATMFVWTAFNARDASGPDVGFAVSGASAQLVGAVDVYAKAVALRVAPGAVGAGGEVDLADLVVVDPVDGAEVAHGPLVFGPAVRFDFGSSAIDPQEDAAVEAVVAAVRESGATSVDVVGFTDPVGTEGVNMALSQQRADRVAERLAAALPGVELEVLGLGENAVLAIDQHSRRVEVFESSLHGEGAG